MAWLLQASLVIPPTHPCCADSAEQGFAPCELYLTSSLSATAGRHGLILALIAIRNTKTVGTGFSRILQALNKGLRDLQLLRQLCWRLSAQSSQGVQGSQEASQEADHHCLVRP